MDTACPQCALACRVRDHLERTLTDLAIAGHPSLLHIRVPRLHCTNDDCPVRIFRAGLPKTAVRRSPVTKRVARRILQRMAVDKISVKAYAAALGIGWDTVNSLALAARRTLVYGDPARLAYVRGLGVDEHKWKHVRADGSASFVTVIVDVIPQVDGVEPARLLDVVPGRSAEVFRTWLAARPQGFRDSVKVATINGYTGYAKAAGNTFTGPGR